MKTNSKTFKHRGYMYGFVPSKLRIERGFIHDYSVCWFAFPLWLIAMYFHFCRCACVNFFTDKPEPMKPFYFICKRRFARMGV